MGFYGNITNTSRTQFQFDKVYTSRKEMDESAKDDGIYAGRYVLVNYEEEGASDYYKHAYKIASGDGFQFGSSMNGEEFTRFKWVNSPTEPDDPNLYIENYLETNVISEKRYADLQPLYIKSHGNYVLDESNTYNARETYYKKEVVLNADAVYEGQVITIPPDHEHNIVDLNSTTWEFWKCSGFTLETIQEETEDENEPETIQIRYANFTQYFDMYSLNYNLDVETYKTSRGYDSTVWQKVYQGGEDKYVMVAELNTIVPTFDLEADAPTMVPLTPHFDADSTNVYYKLHWSPSWGFRVKGANPDLTGPILNQYGTDSGGYTKMSSDPTLYPSDETTGWFKTEYDGVNQITNYIFSVGSEGGNEGHWVNVNEEERETMLIGDEFVRESVFETPAAIYYNKDGFDPEYVSYGYFEQALEESDYKSGVYYKKVNGNYILADDLLFDENETYYKKIEDHILVQPTGRSGHVYNAHTGSITDTVQEDTQELSIMLPTLGDTISAIWDLIYGGEEVNDGIKRNLDITWETARAGMDRHGLRLVTDFDFGGKYVYKTKNVDTVAGALNSVHDLLGMIITSASHVDLINNMDALDENRIYYDETEKTFNRKHKIYTYTELDNEEDYEYEEITLTDDPEEAGVLYIPGTFFTDGPNNTHIIDTSNDFDSQKTYYIRKLSKENEFTKENPSKYVLFDGMQYAYKDYTGVKDGFHYEEDENVTAANYVSGKYYLKDGEIFQKEADDSTYNSSNIYYERFEVTDPLFADYVRDSNYHKDKTYYKWNEITTVPFAELSDVYEKNKFYYRDGQGNYRVSQADTPSADIEYYRLIEDNVITLEDTGYGGVYVPNKYLYNDGNGNYTIDTDPRVTVNRTYYVLDSSNQANINGEVYSKKIEFIEKTSVIRDDPSLYVKDVYYIWVGDANAVGSTDNESDYQRYSGDYDSNLRYFIRKETLTKITNTEYYNVNINESFVLIQFYEHEFFIKDKKTGDFKVLTRLSDTTDLVGSDIVMLRNNVNESGTYELRGNDWNDPTVSAMVIQDQFYEPGKFHYITDDNFDDYTDLVLDNYPIKTHGTNYYRISKVGQPFGLDGKKFFEPYKYYSYNENSNEYELITDGSQLPSVPFYSRDGFYVVNDSANIYPKGALWNYDTEYIPATLTLARRTESFGFEHFEDFARNVNTMHGMLLKIRAMLEYENDDTRDLKTVRGALNTLADKIAQFASWKPGETMIVDDYGRLHGADRIDTKWTKIEVDTQIINPRIWVTHKWTAIPSTTHTTNLKENNSASLVNIYPLYDETGHIGGTHTETYQLPEAFGIITGDSGTLAAGGTHASIKFEGDATTVDNKTWTWIKTAVDSTNRKVKFTHEYNPGTDTSTPANLATSTSASFTDVKPIIDANGHVIAWNSSLITFPNGYSQFTADNAGGLAQAADTYDSFKLEGSTWIQTAVDGTNQKITFTHKAPVVTGAHAYGETTAQTPAFGATFKVPSFSIDDTGHISVVGDHTVTVPSLSLTSGNATAISNNLANVVTGLTYAAGTNDGTFTKTESAVKDLLLTGYTATTITQSSLTAVGASDSIGSALNKLQNGINNINSAIDALDNNGQTAGTGEVISAVSQTNGKISVSKKSLQATDIPDISGNTFTYNTNKTTSVATMAATIDTINSTIDGLDLNELAAAVGDGQFIGTISQSNGQVSASLKTLTAADIPDISENSFDYTPTGESVAQSFTLQDIVQRLINLEAEVQALGE